MVAGSVPVAMEIHPDVLVMLERWRDLAALQGALAKHYKGPDDPSVAFFKLVEGAPARERYEV